MLVCCVRFLCQSVAVLLHLSAEPPAPRSCLRSDLIVFWGTTHMCPKTPILSNKAFFYESRVRASKGQICKVLEFQNPDLGIQNTQNGPWLVEVLSVGEVLTQRLSVVVWGYQPCRHGKIRSWVAALQLNAIILLFSFQFLQEVYNFIYVLFNLFMFYFVCIYQIYLHERKCL